ncbi:MAG TPA: DUF3597 domain-containing protein [Thermoanaerobaculia bacterium]|nr:DUF3597 domain-containing protein [Thermoanaerobaculia bacterium]
MGFFDNILHKLGLGEEEENVKAAPQAPTPEMGGGVAVVEPMTMVDVEAKLDKLSRDSKPQLNWKTSIVDLLKLLDIDSSYQARKELATELDCPTNLMADSAQMNMWLHKAVMKKIADNGGNVPKELLD